MHKIKILQLLVLALLSLAAQKTAAQATLSVQGTLQNATGGAVDNGEYAVTFKLYTVAAGGTAIWSETQGSVRIVGGVYSVTLGSVNPLNVPFDQTYFLGITVGTDDEHTPRARLTAAPYALSLLGQDNKFPSTGMVKMEAVATGQATTTATSYAVTADDHVIFLDHTANQNITLPAATAANAGRHLVLVNKEAVTKTLTSSNYVNIEGATSTTIPAKSVIELQSNGSTWRQTGGYVTPGAPTRAHVRCTGAGGGSSPSGQRTTVPWTEGADLGGDFSNNTFTAPRNGYYQFNGTVNTSNGSTTISGHSYATLLFEGTALNGTGSSIRVVSRAYIPAGSFSSGAPLIGMPFSTTFYMNAGENIILKYEQFSGVQFAFDTQHTMTITEL
jgi:hypothetical protein